MHTGHLRPCRSIPVHSTGLSSLLACSGRDSRRAVSGLLLLLFGLLGPLPAFSQGLGRSSFFNTDNVPSGDATNAPSAKRSRFLRLNAPLLQQADSPLHQPAPADWNLDSSRLELNLFNDITLTAAFEKTIYRNDTN